MVDLGLMWKMALTIVIPLLSGCSDVKDERFATWTDARQAGAIERGWIPPFVPASARDISDTHNLDTNEQMLTFIVPPEAVKPMLESITPRTELKGAAAIKAFAAVEWNESAAKEAEAILLCTRTNSGGLVANHRTGEAVYVSPVEWAREHCTRPH